MPIMLPEYPNAWTFGGIQTDHQNDWHYCPGEQCSASEKIVSWESELCMGLVPPLTSWKISRRYLTKCQCFLRWTRKCFMGVFIRLNKIICVQTLIQISHDPPSWSNRGEDSDSGKCARKEGLLSACLLRCLLRSLGLPDPGQEDKEALEIRFLLYRDGMTEYEQNAQ